MDGKIDVLFERWKGRIRELKLNVHALYLAYQDPRTPWYAKAVALCVVAYALSPIDLIPDPIPVLGYVDDVILLPVGILLAIRLIPPAILAECRTRAAANSSEPRTVHALGAAIVVLVWLAVAAGLLRYVLCWIRGSCLSG